VLTRLISHLFFLSFALPLSSTELNSAPATVSNEVVRSKIIAKLETFKKRNRLTSLSFAFFHGDNDNFSHTTGYENVRTKRTATPQTRYTIASVTKAITGMTLVDLVHQNYLSLGDSVHKFIPAFPPNVTVVDLLNHTSGFHREKENEKFLTNSSYKNVLDYLPIKFRYANFNYSVAGAVIEAASGKDFAVVASDYYESVTGSPLTFSDQKEKQNDPGITSNYVRKGRRLISHEPVDFGLWRPAAFAQTTAIALAKFLRYHMTPQFLEFIETHAVKIKEFKRRGRVEKECYSLGFRLKYKDDELQYVFHNGFLYGVISTLYYFPQKDAGFAAISNMSSYPHQRLGLGSLYRTVEKILDAQFNKELAEFTAANGYSAGRQYFELVKKLGQGNQKVLTRYANKYINRSKYEEAIGVLKLIKYLFPQSHAAYRKLANIYMKIGDEELAEQTLIQGIMAEPKTKKSAKMLQNIDNRSGTN